MSQLNFKQVVSSVTIFSAIAYIICGFFYMLLPNQTATFFNYLFHGSIAIVPITLAFWRLVWGLIATVILSLIGAAFFVWIYNKFGK